MTDQDRLSRLEGVVEQLNVRLVSLEANINARFASLEANVNARFNNIDNRMTQQFWLHVGSIVAVLLGAAGIVVTVLLAK